MPTPGSWGPSSLTTPLFHPLKSSLYEESYEEAELSEVVEWIYTNVLPALVPLDWAISSVVEERPVVLGCLGLELVL